MAAPLSPQQKRLDGGGRKEDLIAWDRQYREKGRIWRGAPAKLPDLPEGSRVLELGCGNGKTLAAMLRRSWRVAALDISTLALRLGRDLTVEVSRRRDPDRPDSSASFAPLAPLRPPSRRESSNHRHHPVGLDFVAADASHLPFRGGGFDAVIAFHVLGHLR
ncbi:MAG: class I SAM-dependent methyltransferase, partial [Methanothrix sp.]